MKCSLRLASILLCAAALLLAPAPIAARRKKKKAPKSTGPPKCKKCKISFLAPELCPPGWCSNQWKACETNFLSPSPEVSNFPGPAGTTMACAGVHDPTHLIATDEGYLVMFGSGQQVAPGAGCSAGIVQYFMRPGTNKWISRGSVPMFGACDALPEWVPKYYFEGGTLSDFDAPSVLYSAEPKFPDRNGVLRKWVMYYSVYVSTTDVEDPDSSAQACIGRATATGDVENLVWADDATPVFCSNIKYDAQGHVLGSRYLRSKTMTAEEEYVEATDDGYGIDPALYETPDGDMYMTWGSGVIHTVLLDQRTGHLEARAMLDPKLGLGVGPGKESASDPAYHAISKGSDGFNEAPYVYYNPANQFYYLWVNWHGCCAAACSTYEIRVGRSKSPTGPFLDKEGRDMGQDPPRKCTVHGEKADCAGGSLFLTGEGRFVGPGHAGVLKYKSKSQAGSGAERLVFTFHYYDNFADGSVTEDGTAGAVGAAKLGARLFSFDNKGWPVLAEEEWDVCDFTGCDSGSAPADLTCDLDVYGRTMPTAPPTASPTEAPVSSCASQGSKGACLRRVVLDGKKCLWKGSKKGGNCVDKPPVVCSNISKKKNCKKAKECKFEKKRCVAKGTTQES